MDYIKEQLAKNDKVALNRSADEIQGDKGGSLSDWVNSEYDSLDNISFDAQRIEDEEDNNRAPEVNLLLKFHILPEEVGILHDGLITSDDILQDSQRDINTKRFDKQFLNIFQSNFDNEKAKNEVDNSNYSFYDQDEQLFIKDKVETFVPTLIKMRQGDHRNYIINLKGK